MSKNLVINDDTTMRLNELANPKNFQSPIEIDGLSNELILKFYESMLLIRKVEDLLAQKKKDGHIGGPVHLCAGQEAIPVAISSSLSSDDFVFGAHRSHGHLLALGSCLRKFFAEILGKKTGHCKGLGGSMHLIDETVGFYGSVPIMAATVPMAVGSAISAKIRKTSSISVSYFGDGAIEEGVIVEAMNLAKIQAAPILFVAENNLFASHMNITERQPDSCVSRFAEACRIPFCIVDGNDVVSVHKAASNFINEIRLGQGPRFLECVTYRHYGHVDWREDVDVGVNRSMEDITDWRARDPIKRLLDSLNNCDEINQADLADIDSNTSSLNESSWELAFNDPYPDKEDLLVGVYSQLGLTIEE